jgi:hypothetical protein
MKNTFSQFSSSCFEKLGLDSLASRHLADRLAEATYQYLMPRMGAELHGVVQQLNSIGHDLKLSNKTYNSIEYCSDFDEVDGYCYGLMVEVAMVIATGYAHTITNEEAWDRDPFESWEDKVFPWDVNVDANIIYTYEDVPAVSSDKNNLELGNYSLEEFIRADTVLCEDLCDQLEAKVKQDIHNHLLGSIIDILDELNKEGHNLKEYGEISAGAIPFRDEDENHQCKLRFAVDIVVTIFFRKRVDAN